MKKTYKLLLSLNLCLLLASCKKDSTAVPDTNANDGLQPTLMRLPAADGSETIYRFEYDSNNNLIKAVYTNTKLSDVFWSGTFQYDANGKMVSGFYDGDMNEDGKVDDNDKFTLYYKYDNKENLIETVVRDSDGSERINRSFKYDEAGFLTGISSDYYEGHYVRYERSNDKNIGKKYKKNPGYDPVQGYIYEEYLAETITSYDMKKGVLSGWKKSNFAAVAIAMGDQLDIWMRNNFTEKKNYYPSGAIQSEESATYLYDENNYPTGITLNGITITKAFEYKK